MNLLFCLQREYLQDLLLVPPLRPRPSEDLVQKLLKMFAVSRITASITRRPYCKPVGPGTFTDPICSYFPRRSERTYRSDACMKLQLAFVVVVVVVVVVVLCNTVNF